MPTQFQRLVERSISAWNSLYLVTHGNTVIPRWLPERLRKFTCLEELLGEDTTLGFWFFQTREAFFQQNALSVWNEDTLDSYILIPVGGDFVNRKDCYFVSHFWKSPEDPDPDGRTLSLLQDDMKGGEEEWSYIWIDWTCLPQSPRNQSQQAYFQKSLLRMHMLIRNCAFTWRYPRFAPRLWILFEIFVFTLTSRNHLKYPFGEEDIEMFLRHLDDLRAAPEVEPFVNDRGYRCTNNGDKAIILSWMGFYFILTRLFSNDVALIRNILDAADLNLNMAYLIDPFIKISMTGGYVEFGGVQYKFRPMPIPNISEES